MEPKDIRETCPHLNTAEWSEEKNKNARMNRESIRSKLKGLFFGNMHAQTPTHTPIQENANEPLLTDPKANKERIRTNLKGLMFGELSRPNTDSLSTGPTQTGLSKEKCETGRLKFNFKEEDDSTLAEVKQEADGFFLNTDFSAIYEERQILGEGTVATVKKCIRRSNGKAFAVKISRTKDLEIILALKKEFINLKRLDHENIVKVYELYYNTHTHVMNLVMELADGKELFEMISELGKYTEKMASQIFAQILRAIEYLHSRGVCHRDLKPNNILVNSKGKVKIIDFNVAKFYDDYKTYDSNSMNNYQMLTYTGTIAFTAPEVFLGGEYSESVDMWSAGVVLYTMLCGYQPFRSQCVKNLIDEIIAGNFDLTGEDWSQISVAAKDLIEKCLKRAPEERILPLKALSHPWILNNSDGDNDLTPRVQSNLSRNTIKLVKSKFHREKIISQNDIQINSPRSLSALLKSLCILLPYDSKI
eukprot:TRINITY_DN1645_c0_g2_i3.p1 TRINITY_DN1645_c0_g2~~TRINITY_DN1645_c0_g2_i3.p1  ORF type:complete len:476 (+),score=63.62 TRINITY_DN1645_c0_g2_i3:251-1678(+)